MWLSLIFSLIASIGAFTITWRVYHHFWSLAEAVHQSNFSYWMKRFFCSLGFAFGTFFVLFFITVAEPSKAPNAEPSKTIGTQSTSVFGNQSLNSRASSPITSPVEERKSTDSSASSEDGSKSNTHAQVNDNKSPLQNGSQDHSTITQDPISTPASKPKDQEYSGDDPIIRARLGLPPKSQDPISKPASKPKDPEYSGDDPIIRARLGLPPK